MPGWVVYDTARARPYIRRFLKTEEEAEALRQDLLRPYESRHPWRRRISVIYWQRKMPGTRGKKSDTIEA